MVKASVTDIMNDLNRQRDPADGPAVATGQACNPAAVDYPSGTEPPDKDKPDILRSICFNEGDNETTEWFPQGVTSVADMEGDQQWGSSPQQLIVSWYDNNGTTNGQRGVRVTFVNRSTGAYRHVLLVYPKGTSSQLVTYESVRVSQDKNTERYDRALHAGGIIWYGNYLFVTDTARGFRVFDMRRIYDLGASDNGTTSQGSKIGLDEDEGVYHAHAYRYVMPQVGSWTSTASNDYPCAVGYEALNFSHASLDRSGTDHIVAGEYCGGGKDVHGRVAAWPVAGAFDGDGELIIDPEYRWNADAAYRLPQSNIQGATRFNDRWYLSQSRGQTPDKTSWERGRLYVTQPTTDNTGDLVVQRDLPLAKGAEDLSHWPGGTPTGPTLGHMWTLSEHPGPRKDVTDGQGQRMLYSIAP